MVNIQHPHVVAAGPWALGPWALGLGPWAGPWALGPGPWALGLGQVEKDRSRPLKSISEALHVMPSGEEFQKGKLKKQNEGILCGL